MEMPAVLQMSIDKYKTLRNKTLHAVGKLLMTAVMTPLWKCSLALTAGKKLGLDSDHKALLFLHLCSVLPDLCNHAHHFLYHHYSHLLYDDRKNE